MHGKHQRRMAPGQPNARAGHAGPARGLAPRALEGVRVPHGSARHRPGRAEAPRHQAARIEEGPARLAAPEGHETAMEVTTDALRERYANKPLADLRRIAESTEGEYTSEAVTVAREVLASRAS